MLGRFTVVGAALLTAFPIVSPAFAGKLADAGRATRTSSPSSSNGSSSGSSSSSSDSGSSRPYNDDGAGAALALYIVVSPWMVPYMALEPESRGRPSFEPYPYSNGQNGLLRYPEPPPADEDAEEQAGTDARNAIEPGKKIGGQLRAEGGYILGGVYRGGVGARLSTASRFELDGAFNGLVEPLADGTTDRATFGNLHLALRFAQSERVQFRTGFGFQAYSDKYGTEPGVDFMYGFEIEPGGRLVLGVEGNVGSANKALVWQARATLGVMVGPIEIYGGYHHIGIDDVPLGGPTLGLRAWL